MYVGHHYAQTHKINENKKCHSNKQLVKQE